ncbi:AAA family ATPase [Agrobacterium sp. ICMP 6402]|uniref:AAA family ATPase n=1 Tax=Agrobacterium sp. ICMP 6402 TaxID=2292443 RepID=UPI001885D26E|nr:AAA family ATPase [Agrobacterium sp. ICMP 6402]
MTGSLIAEKIKIAAFRGITEPLELDFTAPVTLVYAPNGTGKTTFCEAIEWLLTGQVERLRDGQWSNDVLKSAFLDSATPEVEADLRVGEQRYRMWRTSAGAWIDQRAGNPRRPGDVLEILAPTAAAPDKHHRSAISLRQHYLRGTRFLTSEALAALVDNSPESLDRRKDVFADLLGIRHLRDAEQTSEKYVAELAPFLRNLETQRNALNIEASQLRLELKDAKSEAKSADASLATAEAHLGVSGIGADVPSRIQAAVGAVAKGRYDQDRRTEALEELGPAWPRKTELDAQIASLRHSEVAAVKALDEAQDERKQAENVARAREAVAQSAATEVGRLQSAYDVLHAGLEAVVRATAFAEPYLTSRPPTLESLMADAPETRWDAGAREAKRAQLRAATSAEPRVDEVTAEQARLAARRAALASLLLSPEEMQRLQTVVEKCDIAVARARSDAEALAGPIATLQSAGRSVVNHQHEDEANCPLCGFDWRERSSLLDAVQRTLSAAPAIVAAARSIADSAADSAAAARKAVADATQIQTQIRELDREARSLDGRLDADRKILAAMEAPLSGAERRRVLDSAERRLNLADALATLSAEQIAHLSILSENGTPFLNSAAPLGEVKDMLARTMAKRRAALEERERIARSNLAIAQSALVERMTSETVRQKTLEAVRRDKASAERELANIMRLWRNAAGEVAWTPNGLDRLRNEVKAVIAKIDAAESELAAARASWDVQAKHTRLANIEANLAPINAKFARLKASSDVADRLRATFRDSYTTTSQAQVGGLSRVVNALFLRMHANRIVDRIDLGQTESFLHWFADAGAAQLDPGRDFSQGQRQDLALALFLARARGLGGTFFLDEPVAHLDDLNRVGLMDVFRAVAAESGGRTRLVITTASRSLARHMVEKFDAVGSEAATNPIMRVIELNGNGRLGVTRQQVYPVGG